MGWAKMTARPTMMDCEIRNDDDCTFDKFQNLDPMIGCLKELLSLAEALKPTRRRWILQAAFCQHNLSQKSESSFETEDAQPCID